MDQRQREVIMKEFRTGSSRVLITTDLLARGIDVQQVSLVINYDLPDTRPVLSLNEIDDEISFREREIVSRLRGYNDLVGVCLCKVQGHFDVLLMLIVMIENADNDIDAIEEKKFTNVDNQKPQIYEDKTMPR